MWLTRNAPAYVNYYNTVCFLLATSRIPLFPNLLILEYFKPCKIPWVKTSLLCTHVKNAHGLHGHLRIQNLKGFPVYFLSVKMKVLHFSVLTTSLVGANYVLGGRDPAGFLRCEKTIFTCSGWNTVRFAHSETVDGCRTFREKCAKTLGATKFWPPFFLICRETHHFSHLSTRRSVQALDQKFPGKTFLDEW